MAPVSICSTRRYSKGSRFCSYWVGHFVCVLGSDRSEEFVWQRRQVWERARPRQTFIGEDTMLELTTECDSDRIVYFIESIVVNLKPHHNRLTNAPIVFTAVSAHRECQKKERAGTWYRPVICDHISLSAFLFDDCRLWSGSHLLAELMRLHNEDKDACW